MQTAASLRAKRSNLVPFRSAERPLENLVHIGIAERLQRLRPLPCHAAALGGGPHAAVPADLLHVVIELDAVAVRVEREGRVVDAGIKLGRQVDQRAALRLQERDRLAQLRVIGQLDAERQAGRMRAEAKNAAQFLRVQREAVVLGAGAQEDAARAAINALLAFRQPEMARVEGLGAIDILDEQPHRADLGDLERPRQQHAVDIIGLAAVRQGRAMAGENVDAFSMRLGDLGGLRHLRQFRLLAEPAIIHVARLRLLVPADLLDAVIEFVGVTVRVVDIGVPVAAGHVAPDALDADLLLLEIAVGLDDLLEAAALPGDLVDRDLGRELAVGAPVHDRLREQHHRVMVGAVAHEIAVPVAKPGVLRKPRRAGEIGDVGHREAQQVAIEMARALDIASTLNPKWPRRRILNGRSSRMPPTL